MNMLFAAAVLAITLFVTAGPSHAFKFSFDGVRVVTVDELNALVDDETTEESYILWMQPSKGVRPPDTFYKLCSWAHDLPYRENERPSKVVYDCICTQMKLERNWWVSDFNTIYPDGWYGVALTAEEWRNVIARMTIISPVADDSLLVEQVEENTDAIAVLQNRQRLAESAIAKNSERIDQLQESQPQQEHGHTVIQKRIDDLQNQQQRTQSAVEENDADVDDLQEQQQLTSEITEENSEAIVALGSRTERLEQAFDQFGNALSELRQLDEQAESDRENLRREVRNLSSRFDQLPIGQQSNEQFYSESAERTKTSFSEIWEWLERHVTAVLVVVVLVAIAVLIWLLSKWRARSNASPNETQEDVFTTDVVDTEHNRHPVNFERGTPDSQGRERVISPWTGNPILRTRAPMHAQERYNKEGSPRQRS